MHYKKRIISCILTLSMLAILLPAPANAEDLAASGTTNGDALVKNATFSDIANNANADNIMKMSVYSIVREYGSNMYRPNQAATRQDIIAALVRSTGRQDEAMKLGEQMIARDPSLSSVNAYLMGHIDTARNAGILTAQEAAAAGTLTASETAAAKAEADKAKYANWKMTKTQYDQLLAQKLSQKSFDKAYRVPANREETALWISRALGLSAVTGADIMSVYSYNDWRAIKTENLPYIEAVLQKGIMKGAASAFSPKGTISRGEMASIMNMVVNQSLDKLGYKTGYGKVTSVSMVRDFGAVTDTYTTSLMIQTPASDTVGINIQKKSTTSSTSQQTVPVIKNGKIGNESLVTEGDIVEYTLNKNNEAVLLHIAKLNEINGTFVVYDPQNNTVQVGDQNNNMYYLKVMPDSAIMVQQEPVDIGRLEPNSPAKVVFANDILKSISVDTAPELVSGTEKAVRILFADTMGNVIKVADEYNNKQYLELADTAAIYINGDLQDIGAIGYDQDAVVRIFNGKVHEVKIYTDTFEEDSNRLLTLTASVKEVSPGKITLLTDDNPNTPVEYTVDGNTPIIKDKQSVGTSVLRQGDRVKIQVNSTNSKYITRMEVQGSGVLVQGIYKGDIKEVIPETQEIVLSNVYTYGFYDWDKKDGYIRYKLGSDAGIYNKDTKLSAEKLKDYIGKTIYAVSKKNFGTEEIVKAILKDGYEDTINKSIYDVKWTTKELTLSDDRVLSFSDGSIIIKDGRLLDPLYLTKYSGAFVVQNRSSLGTGSAQLISLDSFNGFSNFNITKGYLHNMGEDYITVENSYRLENNEWVEAGEPTFLINDETYVYDSVIKKGEITVDEFLASRYKPYTYTWPNYKSAADDDEDYHEDNQYHYDYSRYKSDSKFHQHFLMYAITDSEGNAQAINLIKKDKNSFNDDGREFNERFLAGQISDIDEGNNRITLTDARDYSAVYNQWKAIMADVPLDTEKIVILKDGEQIDLNEVEAGDNVYIMSDDDYALFMMVE